MLFKILMQLLQLIVVNVMNNLDIQDPITYIILYILSLLTRNKFLAKYIICNPITIYILINSIKYVNKLM